MVTALVTKYCPELQVPDSVKNTQEAVLEMRNAFEHIDERAEAKVGGGKYHADALTNFQSAGFRQGVDSSIQGPQLGFRVGRYRRAYGLSGTDHGRDRRTGRTTIGTQEAARDRILTAHDPRPDLVFVYRKRGSGALVLVRIGSHALIGPWPPDGFSGSISGGRCPYGPGLSCFAPSPGGAGSRPLRASVLSRAPRRPHAGS